MNNICIIWDDKEQKLSEFRLACIKRIKEVYPKVNLSCITKNKNLLTSIIDTHVDWGEIENEVWKKWYVKSIHPDLLSDYFRYLYLSKNPYTLYIDTDIYIHEPIQENDYLAKWKGDYCALWNGNETRFFEYIVNLRNGNGGLSNIAKHYPFDCGDLSRWMSHKTKTKD